MRGWTDVAFRAAATKNENMDAIRFNTVVGDDQVIHLPEGLVVPSGPCEVTLTPAPSEIVSQAKLPPGTWDWLLELVAEAERNPVDLPTDLAENHDFYAHGKPRE
jgi:hypothetical protein